MIENELGPLTVHIRCPEYKQSRLKSEQSDSILPNLFKGLNNLLAVLWKPEYKNTNMLILCQLVRINQFKWF